MQSVVELRFIAKAFSERPCRDVSRARPFREAIHASPHAFPAVFRFHADLRHLGVDSIAATAGCQAIFRGAGNDVLSTLFTHAAVFAGEGHDRVETFPDLTVESPLPLLHATAVVNGGWREDRITVGDAIS